MDFDAVFVGAGHNALAAAIHLASRGWSVGVFEQSDVAGGAVRDRRGDAAGLPPRPLRHEPQPLRRLAVPCRAWRRAACARSRLCAGGALLRLTDARRPLVRRVERPRDDARADREILAGGHVGLAGDAGEIRRRRPAYLLAPRLADDDAGASADGLECLEKEGRRLDGRNGAASRILAARIPGAEFRVAGDPRDACCLGHASRFPA